MEPNRGNILQSHPVLVIVGGTMTLVNALIAYLVGWPIVHWTEVQVGLVIGLVNAILTPLTTIISMQYTTPYDPKVNNTPDVAYLQAERIAELEDQVGA